MASENDTNDNLANENVIKEKVIKIEDADKFIKAKEKEKRTNNAYLFGKAFGERLRTDKMFLLSFFITLIFLCALSYRTLKNSESSYPGIFKNIMKTSEQSSSNDSDSKSSVHVNETLDISDKVGVYSREVNLTDKLVLSDSCSIDTYKYVYQIKKDKTITKYLYNSCLGAIKVWEDKLDYVSIGDTKYIGTNDVHFLFSGTSMREVDGDTYKIDDDITSIREKDNVKNLQISFIDNSVIFSTYTNIILMRGNTILYNLNKEYTNNGGKLDRYVYQTDDENYKFIVFSNGENLNCYDNENGESLVYTIYSISYDKEKMTFNSPKELISRNKSDGCDNWKADLALLKE